MSLFKNEENLRVVKTAWGKKAINKAAKKGSNIIPYITKISEETYYHISLYQNKYSQEIYCSYDLRDFVSTAPDWVLLETSKIFDRPKKIVAAYVAPNDLIVGEEVWVDDIIEYIPWARHQGIYRLKSFKAKWNGKEFEILFDPDIHFEILIG